MANTFLSVLYTRRRVTSRLLLHLLVFSSAVAASPTRHQESTEHVWCALGLSGVAWPVVHRTRLALCMFLPRHAGCCMLRRFLGPLMGLMGYVLGVLTPDFVLF